MDDLYSSGYGRFQVNYKEQQRVEKEDLNERLNRGWLAEFGANFNDTDKVPLATGAVTDADGDAGDGNTVGSQQLFSATPQSPVPSVTDTSDSPTSTADLLTVGKRFITINNTDVENFINAQESRNTLRKTLYDLEIVRAFLKTKGEIRPIHEIPATELDTLLANFVLSVRKKNGDEFEPVSLRSIISSIDRQLKRLRYGSSIIQSNDDKFYLTRSALSAKHRELKKKGKGNKPNKSDAITDQEIEKLYDQGQLGTDNPNALINTLWWNNTIHFGLRATKAHYCLKWGDVALKVNSDGEEYLLLNERQTKTRTGENIADVRPTNPKMYSTNEDRDPVAAYKLYASKRPTNYSGPEDPFYIAPRTTPFSTSTPITEQTWFKRQCIGENKLGGLLKKMATSGGLLTDKKLTNTSARKHLVKKLRENEIPPNEIIQITGHKTITSVNNYAELPEDKHKRISHLLSNTKGTVPNRHRPASPKASTSRDYIPPPVRHTEADDIHVQNEDAGPIVEPLSLSQINYRHTNEQSLGMFNGAVLHIKQMNIYNGIPDQLAYKSQNPPKRRRLIIESSQSSESSN